MELGVLGPLQVLADGARRALGGPKQRLVLGLLAAHRGRVVTVDELIDALWPEGPQARPRKTLQVYVTRLRSALDTHSVAIRTETAGYCLDPHELPVDADLFERETSAAVATADDGHAAELLRRALGRWRGDAFADLLECASIAPVAVYLDEQRLTARRELFEREIRRDPRAVAGELEQIVGAHPLDEGFAAQLMAAQYRAGRQVDALATYQTLRRNLRAELGIEPAPHVQSLQAQILRHELPVAAAPTPPSDAERHRRRVSVVDIEVTLRASDAPGSSPIDPEDEIAAIAPVRRAARVAISRNGGVMLSDAGDGLSACFGYPSQDHSAEQAVTAAVAIRDLVARDHHDVHVRGGIETGVVVIESPPDAFGHGELTAIAGEPLRVARRLREAAPVGDVAVGPVAAASLDGRVELAPEAASVAGGPGTWPSGGSDGPLLVGELSDRVPTPAREASELLGRAWAFDELNAAAEAARTRASAVVVSGPAGIGKSVLVESFAASLGDEWAIVRIHCHQRQSVTPLHPFRAVLPHLFADDAEPMPRAILAALDARWAGRRAALVVEDVHASDPSTLDALNEMLHLLPAGLVVITTRSDKPLELAGEVAPTVVLRPLDRATARTAAKHMAGGQALPLETLNEIADRSGGVPLYVAALTRTVVAGTDARTGRPGSVPEALYDSLMSPLDQLGPARSLAQRCAVLGGPFTASDVATVLDDPHDHAATELHLATMVDAGVLRVDSQGSYRFANDLVGDAAYESLLNSERRELHARVADNMPPELVRAEPERLAFHLEAAGRPLEAARAWRRASARAIRAARHREAQQHARRALALLDELPPPSDEQAVDGVADVRGRALMNLAIGLQGTSHGSTELREVITALDEHGVANGDPVRSLLIGMIDVSNRHALGDFAGATEVAHRCLAAVEADGDPLWVAFASQFLGASLVWRGMLPEGVEHLERAAAYWSREEPTLDSARTAGALWSLLALAHHLQGRDDADELAGKALDAIPSEDGYGRCLVVSTVAIIDQMRDRPADVRDAVEPIWSLAMDIASEFWTFWAQTLLGWAIAHDEPDTGLTLMSEAVDDAPTRQAVPYFCSLFGSRLAAAGHPEAALERFDEGLEVVSETGEGLWEPLLHLGRARVLSTLGRHVDAVAAADEARALAAAMGAGLVTTWCDSWSDAGPPEGDAEVHAR